MCWCLSSSSSLSPGLCFSICSDYTRQRICVSNFRSRNLSKHYVVALLLSTTAGDCTFDFLTTAFFLSFVSFCSLQWNLSSCPPFTRPLLFLLCASQLQCSAFHAHDNVLHHLIQLNIYKQKCGKKKCVQKMLLTREEEVEKCQKTKRKRKSFTCYQHISWHNFSSIRFLAHLATSPSDQMNY